MNKLFKKRLNQHLIQMVKYLKYVFNDFFVIALMFFIGALGFYYAKFLKTLATGLWWEPIVLIIILLFTIHFCGLATLIKNPDKVFLAPKEYELDSYFKATFKYSCVMAFIVQTIIWFVLTPFISVSFSYGKIYLFAVLLLMLLTKLYLIELQFANIRAFYQDTFINNALYVWMMPALIFIVAFYLNIFVAILLAAFGVFNLFYAISKQKHVINWKFVIDAEEKRMNRIYRFFNLFTDVPAIKPQTHRRKYFDFLLRYVKKDHKHLFTNLYLRTFIRDGDTSSLYFRLLIVMLLLLVFINNQIMAVCIGVLFIYLTGIQILPFCKYFDSNVFIHIYPITVKQQQRNFSHLLQILLSVEIVFMVVGMLIARDSFETIVIALVIGIIEMFALSIFKLRKENN